MYLSWLLFNLCFPAKNSATYRIGHLKLKGYPHPLVFRHGTSDVRVVRQIFLKEEYKDFGNDKNLSYIIDCGANIGCTAFYFLSRYPEAKLIAIEPDEGNFAVLKRNLEPFGERALALRAGLWSSDKKLRVDRGNFGDGREWSFQVRECREGEQADVNAVGLDSVLRSHKWDRIDLAKIDIERAEVEVFSPGCDSWLSRTRNIAIELHGPDCEEAFFKAMSRYDYQVERTGELTICRSIRGPRATGEPGKMPDPQVEINHEQR
jgi:FkbM family methyltransferase